MSRSSNGAMRSTVTAVDSLLLEWEHGRLSRRSVMKRAAALGLTVPALAALAGQAGPGRAAAAVLNIAQDDPSAGVMGGTLNVVILGDPPHLDEHQSTAGVIANVSYCMYETLFAYDAAWQPVPQLVETHTISADGLVHTMALRKGVMFHNGEELKAADAIASIDRWGRISGVGKNLMANVTEVVATDDYTFEIRLTQSYGTILIAFSNNTQACVIHPKSVIDAMATAFPEDVPVTEEQYYIGTGPYKLVEWQRDAHIRFERFDAYISSADAPNGYAGKKFAYADMIEFIPVPDEAARVAGLQAGDYHVHVPTEIGNDQYEVLNGAPGIVAEILTPTEWDVFFLNWKSPMTGNLAMRQAIQASMNHLPILQSARGGDDFIRLDPSLMMTQTPWHSLAGEEYYDVNDPELAKAKLQEAGYDGTPLRFLATEEYTFMYGAAIVLKQQLEDVGITVDFQVTDWATVLDTRKVEDAWEIFITSHGFVPDPTQISYVGQMNVYPGWWSSESSLALAAELASESDFDTRKGIYDQIQTAAYTEIPSIKVGDASTVSFRSDRLGGWDAQFERGPKFWNFWLNG